MFFRNIMADSLLCRNWSWDLRYKIQARKKDIFGTSYFEINLDTERLAVQRFVKSGFLFLQILQIIF